jgi:hypothetical protein
MGKTHAKPLAAWHGRETAWERHAICESALAKFLMTSSFPQIVVVHLMTMNDWILQIMIGKDVEVVS